MTELNWRTGWRASVFALAGFVLLTFFACGSDDDPPLIFAAASLADALNEAAEAYETETGLSVEFNFGGSTALATQIARLDAPADGVILAGNRPVQLLVDEGLVVDGNVSVVARNSLVVVSSDASVLDALGELATDGATVAIADPALAPAGQYAREALESVNAWDVLEGQIIPTLDVRAALAAAMSGSSDYAIVYATDALTEPGLSVALEVDTALHRPVVYPAAALSGSSRSGAVEQFLEFLAGSEGQRIMQSHGFITD